MLGFILNNIGSAKGKAQHILSFFMANVCNVTIFTVSIPFSNKVLAHSKQHVVELYQIF